MGYTDRYQFNVIAERSLWKSAYPSCSFLGHSERGTPGIGGWMGDNSNNYFTGVSILIKILSEESEKLLWPSVFETIPISGVPKRFYHILFSIVLEDFDSLYLFTCGDIYYDHPSQWLSSLWGNSICIRNPVPGKFPGRDSYPYRQTLESKRFMENVWVPFSEVLLTYDKKWITLNPRRRDRILVSLTQFRDLIGAKFYNTLCRKAVQRLPKRGYGYMEELR